MFETCQKQMSPFSLKMQPWRRRNIGSMLLFSDRNVVFAAFLIKPENMWENTPKMNSKFILNHTQIRHTIFLEYGRDFHNSTVKRISWISICHEIRSGWPFHIERLYLNHGILFRLYCWALTVAVDDIILFTLVMQPKLEFTVNFIRWSNQIFTGRLPLEAWWKKL